MNTCITLIHPLVCMFFFSGHSLHSIHSWLFISCVTLSVRSSRVALSVGFSQFTHTNFWEKPHSLSQCHAVSFSFSLILSFGGQEAFFSRFKLLLIQAVTFIFLSSFSTVFSLFSFIDCYTLVKSTRKGKKRTTKAFWIEGCVLFFFACNDDD